MPRWAIIAGSVLIAVASAALAQGVRVGRYEERINTVDARLCRIEAALHIEPWPSCRRS